MQPALKKPLSKLQALNCEQAKEPTCKCRCGGRLHGAKRGGTIGDPPASFFAQLPEDDPHYVPSAEAVAQKRRERLEQKRREREERIARYYEQQSQGKRPDWAL